MVEVKISDKFKKKLLEFLKKNKKADLIMSYLFYIEDIHQLKPVLFPHEKKIYQSVEDLIEKLKKENKLCRKTSIKVQFEKQDVDENTKKVYICPFTGKVFGDNTHPNPQDAIYDWVSKCPENKERKGGLHAKRFFVSEDPELIKNYIKKRKEPIIKEVYSSSISGKLFNSEEGVLEDFKKNYIKQLSLIEVQNQNRFEIEKNFLNFLQDQLKEDKISNFVKALSKIPEFEGFLEKWFES
ncbi:MAG: hypothetical protein AMS24_01635 [Chlamydiae bacterium SM23_39]|nr:MAG: hypothetical protein AMS24_01635 [Chlamydiae bacterium SM23_39]